MKNLIYRVIDANFNRVREGLRVCEEFVRFFADDKALTEDFKKIRNRVSKIYQNFVTDKSVLFSARNIAKDVGRKGFSFEKKRDKLPDVFWANLQRSKEALRVLEEFSKLAGKEFTDEFRRLRYRLYELEKKAFEKLKKELHNI